MMNGFTLHCPPRFRKQRSSPSSLLISNAEKTFRVIVLTGNRFHALKQIILFFGLEILRRHNRDGTTII
jgi:hypothetical protein